MEIESKKQEKKKCNLHQLKEEYAKFDKVYGLPEFSKLNQEFEIEGTSVEDTEILLKVIRKHLTEKIFYVLRTLEAFLNPSNAPMFVFNMIKSFSETEKETVKKLYGQLARYEIDAFGLEAEYNEKKEADFIKKVFAEWKGISEELKEIHKFMLENYDKADKKQTKSYFG